MKYTSKLSITSTPDCALDYKLLEWLDQHTTGLFITAAQCIDIRDRDDLMLQAVGARNLYTKLLNYYNSKNKD